MRHWLISLAGICLLGFQSSQLQAQALMMGAGSGSCASFLEELQKNDYTKTVYAHWTQGLITGLNGAMGEKNKGYGVDIMGIILEAKNRCEREPMSLYVEQIYWIYDNKL